MGKILVPSAFIYVLIRDIVLTDECVMEDTSIPFPTIHTSNLFHPSCYQFINVCTKFGKLQELFSSCQEDRASQSVSLIMVSLDQWGEISVHGYNLNSVSFLNWVTKPSELADLYS